MLDLGVDDLVQLERLRRLHQDHGWRFARTYTPDPPHELDELVYSIAHGEWIDILRVRSCADVQAGRFLTESVIGGGCPQACWLATGTLAGVLDELEELPTPAAQFAPHLILPTTVRSF